MRETGAKNVDERQFDLIIVGAGFAGLYMLYKARQLGLKACVLEKGAGVGGTWYWNRYPGAQCDIPSLQYSYSFDEQLQQEWHWSSHHASQPEIEGYANAVADRFDLRRDIHFETAVEAAEFISNENTWVLRSSKGREFRTRFCVMATGGYHIPIMPDIKGLREFRGRLLFTNQWPKGIDESAFDGERVGIIGTGSSGVQTATRLARRPLTSLYIFQRSPGYLVPARDHTLESEFVAEYKSTYKQRRQRARLTGFGTDITTGPIGEGRTADLTEEEFRRRADIAWEIGGIAINTVFPDFASDEAANHRVADFLRSKVRQYVKDPDIAEKLCAYDYYIGAKRIIVIDGYLEIFNDPRVHLVDLREDPIEAVTAEGVRTREVAYNLDSLICATGFDSATGAMLAVDFVGLGGLRLADHWASGHRTYLGIGVAGFPNLFMIAQAGSPGIRSHVMVSIEQHVEWISELLRFAQQEGVTRIEATGPAEDAWTSHVAEVAGRTLFTIDDTQHLGCNVPGKPRVVTSYLGGVGPYRMICDNIAANHYEGWRLRRFTGEYIENDVAWSGPGRELRWEERDAAVGRTSAIV